MKKVNFDELTEHELDVFEEVRNMVVSNNSLDDFYSELCVYDDDHGSNYSDLLNHLIDLVAKAQFDTMVIQLSVIVQVADPFGFKPEIR